MNNKGSSSDPVSAITCLAAMCLNLWMVSGANAAGGQGLDVRATGVDSAAHSRSVILASFEKPDRISLGQNTGHAEQTTENYRRYFVEAVAKLGGNVPLICGADYGWDQITPAGVRAVNTVLINHWRRGGLVELTFHPSNPCTGKTTRSVDGVDFAALADPSSVAGKRWRRDLSIVADGLAELQQAGVAVLWRPLHEANGGYFWWCSDGNPGGAWTCPGDFRQLWQDMHHYFTVDSGLRNLIWVYAANAKLDEHIRPVTDYYPGGALVDIVGLDLYVNRLDGSTLNADGGYDKLVALGKPFAITEIGPPRRNTGTLDGVAVLDAVQRFCPRAAYVFWWQSWEYRLWLYTQWHGLAILDNPHARELLADPRAKALARVASGDVNPVQVMGP